MNRSFNSIDKAYKKNSRLSFLWDFWVPLFLTFSLYSGIKYFLLEARYIPSGSMLPALQINDRLFIEKVTYRYRKPKRGDIVVFNSPHSFDKVLISQREMKLPSSFKCSLISFPWIHWIPGVYDSACDAYIKRVIAVGGDAFNINTKGEVFLNGELLKEPYVKNYCPQNHKGISFCRAFNNEVPKGYVLVLGDNRSNSWDSRYWPAGPFLPENQIIGRAVWRFWPLSTFGQLNLKDHNQ